MILKQATIVLCVCGLMFPAVAVATDPGETMIEAYQGLGAVHFSKATATVAVLQGKWGEEMLMGVEFPAPYLREAASFSGDDWYAIGTLTVVADGMDGFSVSIEPSDELSPRPWQMPEVPAGGLNEAWIASTTAAFQQWAAFDWAPFNRTFTADFHVIGEANAAAPLSSSRSIAAAACPGGSCACTGTNGGSAKACCPSGQRPICTCQPCCSGSCRIVKTTMVEID
ncbi:MAG: hypothetical protein O7D91_11370 [Planctomycetota bacterium]|nr:hypothetical protein [Planctomycetota bacterium]